MTDHVDPPGGPTMENTVRALKTTGRRPLLATAAILALGAAALLAQPLPAHALDQLAAATVPGQVHAHGEATGTPTIVDVVRDPTDLPGPIGARGPRRVKVDLETVEVTGQLADGATYHYWTF